MQRFPCPFCGERPEAEFHFAGEAGRTRPERDCSDAEWARYLVMHGNPRGDARELWVHSAGCGRWLEIRRDTLTHVVLAAEPMNR